MEWIRRRTWTVGANCSARSHHPNFIGAQPDENAAGNWHTHYRTWRRARLREIEQHYSARLDDIADVLADFATKIKALGPTAYLQSAAHRPGDPIDDEGS